MQACMTGIGSWSDLHIGPQTCDRRAVLTGRAEGKTLALSIPYPFYYSGSKRILDQVGLWRPVPILPHLPSHPGCHIPLCRVLCAVQKDLVGYPFQIKQREHVHPKVSNYSFLPIFPAARVVFLNIFANLLNVWLNRRHLSSHSCFSIVFLFFLIFFLYSEV